MGAYACPRSEKLKRISPKTLQDKKLKQIWKKYREKGHREKSASSSLRLSADKRLPTDRHNGCRRQNDLPDGTTIGPRIKDEHG